MAKLSEKRRAQLKEAQRKYRENKRLSGAKQVSIWVKESDNLISSNPITSNQDLIINNQLELLQNQLAQIKEIIERYEGHAHATSPHWTQAKKLIAELKKVLE